MVVTVKMKEALLHTSLAFRNKDWGHQDSGCQVQRVETENWTMGPPSNSGPWCPQVLPTLEF